MLLPGENEERVNARDGVRKCVCFGDEWKWIRRPGPGKAKEGMDEVTLQREGAGWTTHAKLPGHEHTGASMQEGEAS